MLVHQILTKTTNLNQWEIFHVTGVCKYKLDYHVKLKHDSSVRTT